MIYDYKTLLSYGEKEIIIEKSKFIAYASPAHTEHEAISFVEKIKTKHKDATHNVPAYVVGYGNEIQRYSDDGEPTGTAGIPVLEVIKKEDLRNVVIVVTRYFGGIKLGAGGLVRAYTLGAKLGIEAGKIVTKRLYQIITIRIDYTLLGKIQNDIIQNGYIIKETIYSDAVDIAVYITLGSVESFKKQAIEWTNARCQLLEGEKVYLTELNGNILNDFK